VSEVVSQPLDDGTLRFKVKAQDGTERDHAIDVLILKLACTEAVDKHKLAVRNDLYVPTVDFLDDLKRRLIELGIEGCTPSIAFQLWQASAAGIEFLKKNTSETPPSDSGSSETPDG